MHKRKLGRKQVNYAKKFGKCTFGGGYRLHTLLRAKEI